MKTRKRRVRATADRVPVRARTERATRNRYLGALAKAIAAYEVEFGVISDEELIAQQRKDRRTAIRAERTRT
jgi:hypothetical protein